MAILGQGAAWRRSSPGQVEEDAQEDVRAAFGCARSHRTEVEGRGRNSPSKTPKKYELLGSAGVEGRRFAFDFGMAAEGSFQAGPVRARAREAVWYTAFRRSFTRSSI